MNVGSTSVVPRTCFAGRFLGWMLNGQRAHCKRLAGGCCETSRLVELAVRAQALLLAPAGATSRPLFESE